MSKLISFLEKYNLVEKVDDEVSKTETVNVQEREVAVELEPKQSTFKAEDITQKPVIKIDEPLIKKEDYTPKQSKTKYNKKMAVNEIYSLYNLDNSTVDTVFMLENLINALPQNLPDEVMKQTIKNIIIASNINLSGLLTDGEQRLKVLVELMNDYYTQTNNEISQYKAEIAKLSSLINNYQDQIKSRETMLQDQLKTVKDENIRIENIMKFFGNQN